MIVSMDTNSMKTSWTYISSGPQHTLTLTQIWGHISSVMCSIHTTVPFSNPMLLSRPNSSIKLLCPCKANRFHQFNLPVIVESADVGLEVLKKAEKEDCLVLRVVERKGRKSEATLRLIDPNLKIQATDLIEWNDSGEAVGGELNLTLNPFEIKTFKLSQFS